MLTDIEFDWSNTHERGHEFLDRAIEFELKAEFEESSRNAIWAFDRLLWTIHGTEECNGLIEVYGILQRTHINLGIRLSDRFAHQLFQRFIGDGNDMEAFAVIEEAKIYQQSNHLQLSRIFWLAAVALYSHSGNINKENCLPPIAVCNEQADLNNHINIIRNEEKR